MWLKTIEQSQVESGRGRGRLKSFTKSLTAVISLIGGGRTWRLDCSKSDQLVKLKETACL